jgi:RNA polymerase sigma-70 factor (ECF subfamily)
MDPNNTETADRVTRRSLVSRLKNWDDQSSWNEFFDAYWRLIYSAALKAGLNDAEAQDVTQETIITVSKSIRSFEYDRKKGSFKGWLLNTTRWRIADQFRRRDKNVVQLHRPDEDGSNPIENIPDPSSENWTASWDRDWERHVYAAALQRVKAQIAPEQFQIFDCYVNKEWPAAKVAKSLSISLGQVYVAKHRVTTAIKKAVKAIENAELG